MTGWPGIDGRTDKHKSRSWFDTFATFMREVQPTCGLETGGRRLSIPVAALMRAIGVEVGVRRAVAEAEDASLGGRVRLPLREGSGRVGIARPCEIRDGLRHGLCQQQLSRRRV